MGFLKSRMPSRIVGLLYSPEKLKQTFRRETRRKAAIIHVMTIHVCSVYMIFIRQRTLNGSCISPMHVQEAFSRSRVPFLASCESHSRPTIATRSARRRRFERAEGRKRPLHEPFNSSITSDGSAKSARRNTCAMVTRRRARLPRDNLASCTPDLSVKWNISRSGILRARARARGHRDRIEDYPFLSRKPRHL